MGAKGRPGSLARARLAKPVMLCVSALACELAPRRLALLVGVALLIPGCGNGTLDCIYTPRVSRENPQPEMTPHERCGVVVGDGLELRPEHLANLSFDADGLGFVLTHDGVFYVDASGRSARTFWYDMDADEFREGVARGIAGGKFGFVDRSLAFVIEPAYDFAFPFENGHAIVCNGCVERPEGEHRVVEGGVWGVIDRQGEVVVPLEYRKEELGKRGPGVVPAPRRGQAPAASPGDPGPGSWPRRPR
jgi:hypothetical protein